ncbi:hypothetical protein F5983_30970 [Streptomyces arboris]|uniref:Uncharacterized protein n=1 Tax=Streptomyces arboris TaxID=2600619 RepID=A0A5N5EF22_9ACTN|nr:hypothetical protein F5983_30970 [Streptomyces arboris]
MRSRIIATVFAAAAATATLAQPAHTAPVVDGVYRFAALQDVQCLVLPESHASRRRRGRVGIATLLVGNTVRGSARRWAARWSRYPVVQGNRPRPAASRP